MGLSGREKKHDDIFNHFDTIHETDGQTDGHRPMTSTAASRVNTDVKKVTDRFSVI